MKDQFLGSKELQCQNLDAEIVSFAQMVPDCGNTVIFFKEKHFFSDACARGLIPNLESPAIKIIFLHNSQ